MKERTGFWKGVMFSISGTYSYKRNREVWEKKKENALSARERGVWLTQTERAGCQFSGGGLAGGKRLNEEIQRRKSGKKKGISLQKGWSSQSLDLLREGKDCKKGKVWAVERGQGDSSDRHMKSVSQNLFSHQGASVLKGKRLTNEKM